MSVNLPRGARLILVPALLGAALGVPAVAPGQPPPAPVDHYRLAAGDLLEILVSGEPELSISTPRGLEIAPDGRIGVPHLGHIEVAGLTCEEAAEMISLGLVEAQVLVRPQVLVRVLDFRSQRINVIGAVRTPGSFPHRRGMTVRDALALAGDVRSSREDEAAPTAADVIRATGEVEPVDIGVAILATAPQDAVVLLPGDTLWVRIDATVSVLGQVGKAGSFTVREGARVSELIAEAGGASGPVADLSGVLLHKADGTVIECDVAAALLGKDGEDPVVEPGDLVYVPLVLREATIGGYVDTPGKYEFDAGDRVSDLLAQAKGVAKAEDPGDLTRVILERADGTVRTLDLSKVFTGAADSESNPTLQPGDRVAVPIADNFVVVSGYVKNPGHIDFRPGETVTTALAKAGDALPGTGSRNAVRIRRRGGEELTVDLEQQDPELKPGDQINVPFVRNRVAVLGHVASPDIYEYEKGDTVVDMIAKAGGPLQPSSGKSYKIVKGDQFRVMLYRAVDGEEAMEELDLRPFYATGDRGSNPEVRPGDIVLVPSKSKTDAAGLLRDLLLIPRSLQLLWGD